MAEADFKQSESVLWHLRVAEGDRLSERSEGGKLPQHKTRALASLWQLKTFVGGASGGMQGGPRRGRSPITGPTLPRAAQASQAPPEGEAQCPKGSKKRTLRRRNRAPRRRPKLRRRAKPSARRAAKNPRPGGEITRREGVLKGGQHSRTDLFYLQRNMRWQWRSVFKPAA